MTTVPLILCLIEMNSYRGVFLCLHDTLTSQFMDIIKEFNLPTFVECPVTSHIELTVRPCSPPQTLLYAM